MTMENNFEKPEVRLVNALIRNGMKIATAESCTGGMIASRITSVAGASGCFDCGVITYSNEQKNRLLNVSQETLDSKGAVSEETALQMCEGVRVLARADIGISVTGIAGPGGGTADKPVGTVCFATDTANGTVTYQKQFGRDKSRDEIRALAAEFALSAVLEAAKKL